MIVTLCKFVACPGYVRSGVNRQRKWATFRTKVNGHLGLAPADEHGNIVILVKPLKTSIFELVAGREDLKYLQPPEALGNIAEAYNQIKDFNSILESWLRRGVYEQEKGHYSFHDEVDLSVLTTEHLKEQKIAAITKINEALKVL